MFCAVVASNDGWGVEGALEDATRLPLRSPGLETPQTNFVTYPAQRPPTHSLEKGQRRRC